MEDQSDQIREALAAGGLDMAIGVYLSAAHRDNPAQGCASAALLPEIAREPSETRQLYTERLLSLVRQVSAELPPQVRDPEDVAFGIFATLIGALQMARAVERTELSDRILAAGAQAARAQIMPGRDDAALAGKEGGHRA
ncbi:hypothetical protein ACFSQT_29415 [Mesorhizobium calcicola]|uniref:TetR family transcriptional regulator n=1 Tax=Mesorhizobium calcicola TaxID=1300310 RepID=A0ABW4WKG5_9HYPH